MQSSGARVVLASLRLWLCGVTALCALTPADFVDLFVRVSNSVAIGMYKKFGYTVYRQVIGYYNGEEDAYGAPAANTYVAWCAQACQPSGWC